ncbi:MAG: hypothetical protein ACYC6G_03310 [Desulfobaccales bacterium]
MKISHALRSSAVVVLLTLLAGLVVLPGCLDNLCKLRLYLYRDVEQKSLQPTDMALLITDPAIVAAVLPEAAAKLPSGLPWAPEQPNYEKEYYQLSIDGVDGHLVYQGRCLNVTPTYICEVRPGSRQVMASLGLFGPSGQQSLKDTASLTLEPGGVYFLYPDGQAAAKKTLLLKAQRLPVPYDAALRAKVMAWLHRNTQGRTLEE